MRSMQSTKPHPIIMRCGLSDHKPKPGVRVVVAIGIQVIFRDRVLYCDGRGKLE